MRYSPEAWLSWCLKPLILDSPDVGFYQPCSSNAERPEVGHLDSEHPWRWTTDISDGWHPCCSTPLMLDKFDAWRSCCSTPLMLDISIDWHRYCLTLPMLDILDAGRPCFSTPLMLDIPDAWRPCCLTVSVYAGHQGDVWQARFVFWRKLSHTTRSTICPSQGWACIGLDQIFTGPNTQDKGADLPPYSLPGDHHNHRLH